MTTVSAAHNVTAMIGRIRGIVAAVAAGETVHPDALDLALTALIAAVRRHDAEVVRTEGHLWSGEAGRAILHTADLLTPKETDQ